MKNIIKSTLRSACAIALLGSFNGALADINSDTELLLNWAELTYPEIFTTHKTTLSEPPWRYRNYGGVVAGVNTENNSVYVMGGPWGNTPTLIGSLAALMPRVTLNADTERLLNWAEQRYPEIFTSHKTTISEPPWRYRSYAGGVVAGVNTTNLNVYVMGGPWGNTPTVLGSLATLLTQVTSNPPPDPTEACASTTLPAGITMTQNGNVITITTNGNCIIPPQDQNYCEYDLPEQPQATGISILTTGVVHRMQMRGLVDATGMFENLLQTGLDFKSCVIHAPSQEFANLTVNTDICYDLTETFKDIPSIPGVLTITPPVQQELESTSTSTIVNDCFATDAETVSNLVTGENWIKTNGNWVKQPTTP